MLAATASPAPPAAGAREREAPAGSAAARPAAAARGRPRAAARAGARAVAGLGPGAGRRAVRGGRRGVRGARRAVRGAGAGRSWRLDSAAGQGRGVLRFHVESGRWGGGEGEAVSLLGVPRLFLFLFLGKSG